MAKTKPREADASATLNRFGGICKDANLAEELMATLIRNFRITSEGDLEKREGFEFLPLPASHLRGYWKGELGGVGKAFFADADRVCRLTAAGTAEEVGTLETSTGDLLFFVHRDRLYILDGVEVYVLDEETGRFAVTPGYAPLVGQEWHPHLWGDTNEDVNLLTSRLRIHFRNSMGTDTFTIPYYATSVDAVLVDDRPVYDYHLEEGYKIIVPSATKDCSVLVAFTAYGAAMAENRRRVCASRAAFGFRTRIDTDELLLFGGSKGTEVFSSTTVPNFSYAYSKYAYPDTSPLYIKATNEFSFGDSEHPVTGFCLSRGRMLGFTTEGTYSISHNASGNDPVLYRIPSGVGCTAFEGVTVVDGDPIVVGETGILRLHAPSNTPEHFTVTDLSEPLWARPDHDLCHHAILCFDPARRELWVRDIREDDSGVCKLYSVDRGVWYEFDGIEAVKLFMSDGLMHFITTGGRLCRMNPRLHRDGTLPIVSTYRSGYMDFSMPEAKKRILRATLSVEGGRSGVNLTVYTENAGRAVNLIPPSQLTPAVLDRRFNLGRFRLFSFRIEHRGDEALRVCGVRFHTKF